jgi:hypothetical protein
MLDLPKDVLYEIFKYCDNKSVDKLYQCNCELNFMLSEPIIIRNAQIMFDLCKKIGRNKGNHEYDMFSDLLNSQGIRQKFIK